MVEVTQNVFTVYSLDSNLGLLNASQRLLPTNEKCRAVADTQFAGAAAKCTLVATQYSWYFSTYHSKAYIQHGDPA